MSETLATLEGILRGDTTATEVVRYWDTFKRNIDPKLKETAEVLEYIFATDTSTTSNTTDLGEYAWKNNTHLPKICEIRDTLSAIYKSTWFPNSNWMRWVANFLDQSTIEKQEFIEGYMRAKVRESGFEATLADKLGSDYLDYGNAFAAIKWVDYRVMDSDGVVEKEGYVGPKTVRVSPDNIAFNLTAESFADSPKIIREVITQGDLALWAQNVAHSDPALAAKIREGLHTRHSITGHSVDDFDKAKAYSMGGFGSYKDYLESGAVELLEFRGSFYDPATQELRRDHRIVVLDRRVVLISEPWEDYLRDGGMYHVGYRPRPDNLWHMGPFDNLVGMQYRIDHLQGAKDDNIDLHIHPTKIIVGDPDETSVGPDKEIRLEEGQSVTFDRPDLSAMQLDSEIDFLLRLMEEFAGSPRQSRGFRTPGEKTLGEVNLLEGNANKLFLDKAVKFEKELIEPCLNGMLAVGRENLSESEDVAIFDNANKVFIMQTITKKELDADGVVTPIGARHFGERNQQLTNLMQIYNSRLGDKIDAHIDGKALSDLVADNMQLGRFAFITPYASLYEQAEMARIQNQISKDMNNEAGVDLEDDLDDLAGGAGEQPL